MLGDISAAQATRTEPRPARSPWDPGFVAALTSGGDSRIAIDPVSGLNKYLCPPVPAPCAASAASCTASIIAPAGFARASETYRVIASAGSQRLRAQALADAGSSIAETLLRYFGVAGAADAILCPSGTDALLTTAMLLAAERPGAPMTAILPVAAETGAGVPLAVTCRQFDGPAAGTSLVQSPITSVEIPLRTADGEPRSGADIGAAFAAAAHAAVGRPVVYLTHSTKTGLVAPADPPPGVDVVVDACQARIDPQTVAAYVARGWPVVVTGSKFFGGPAFSGAILYPRTARRPDPTTTIGTVLRWAAAIGAVEAFAPRAASLAATLRERGAAIAEALAAHPALAPVGGLVPYGASWAAQPSIFTFAIRDPASEQRRLTMAELRPLYERLARQGVRLGQPVSLGAFGGLRIAIGARDLLAPGDGGIARLFAALDQAGARQ